MPMNMDEISDVVDNKVMWKKFDKIMCKLELKYMVRLSN